MATERSIKEIGKALNVLYVGCIDQSSARCHNIVHDAITELSELRKLAEVAERMAGVVRHLDAESPTAIPATEDCGWCYEGTINIGTAIDPEPGPCPRCRCEFHYEAHEDCFRVARAVLRDYDATSKATESVDGLG